MKLWGGRFERGPSETFERFSESLRFDRRLLEADVQGSKAWAQALERAGILTAAERETLLRALDEIAEEGREPAFFQGAADEDVHTLVIRKLKEKVGELAAKMHTGRSRNEQVSLDTRLWLREQIRAHQSRLADLMESLLELAQRYPDAVLPGFTHLRRAQPVLWPHYLLAYFEMFHRDWRRLEAARRAANVLPLGSGALAGSGLAVDRAQIALDLGFDELTRNSMDAAADRDFVLDFLHAASLLMLHLSRLAEDWILYSSEEFGWLELADEVTSGSSLMPHKKNPDALELIRGKCGRVFGSYTSVFVTMKGLPMTYNRDMQEDKERLFDASDTLGDCLEMARAVMGSARLNPEKTAQAAAASWVVATDLAEALARSGVPFEHAHQLVGKLVLESVRSGKQPADWTPEALAAFAPEFTPDMARWLRPEEGMKTREIPGGTGPKAVAAALEEAARRLAELRP
ncbi:MAG TPA: argininosuccinate lyase [Bryobacteraceae bacterium]|nr:argininosuccinate lyase [Bryobacteraceae bacterium]